MHYPLSGKILPRNVYCEYNGATCIIIMVYSGFRQIILDVKHGLLFTIAHCAKQSKHCTSTVPSYWHPCNDNTRTGMALKVKVNQLLARTEYILRVTSITPNSLYYKVTGFMHMAVGPNSPRTEITTTRQR